MSESCDHSPSFNDLANCSQTSHNTLERLVVFTMDRTEIASQMEKHQNTDESALSKPKTTDREPTRTQSRDFAPFDASTPAMSIDYDAKRWPLWKRIYHTTAVATLAFAVTLASSTITPAIFEIQDHFHTTREVATLSLSLYVLGLALGPMLAAPVSELYGRAVVYRTTGLLFILFLVGAGFSKSLGSLLICRLLAGLASGPVLAVGAGTNADLWPPQHRALAVVSYVMMPFLGPSLGPVIGGFATYYKSWRWTQWCATFVAILAYALVLPMHETYLKIILQRQRTAKGTSSGESSFAVLRRSAKVMILRPFQMLVMEPIVIFLSLYSAYTVSLLYAFFAAYPYTFAKIYGFNAWQSGLAFLGITLGVLLAVATAISIDRFVYYKKFLGAVREGKAALPPENRLYAAILGSLGAPIGSV